MSSQAESLALEQARMSALFARPKWRVVVEEYGTVGLETALDVGWEPFAVTGQKVWLRRQAWDTSSPPLPPQ